VLELKTIHNTKLSEVVEVNHLNDMTSLRPENLCTQTEIITIIIIVIYLFNAIGLVLGGSGYFTYIQNMKLVTTKFKSGGLHERHVVANNDPDILTII